MPGAEDLGFPSFSDEEIADLFAALKSLPSIAVAVSGGPDSMALLMLLVRWCNIIGKNAPALYVLSVDHGLRSNSATEVDLVAEVCQQYGLKHQAFFWDGKKSKGNISAKSRDARYDLMCSWCQQQAISHLLVAHTLDDQAETVLLRLARGSGVDGLSAMALSRLWNSTLIYRPLLGVERSRLRHLLEDVSCPYVTDPSNHNLKYDRVKIRQALEVLEPLGITSQALADTADRLRQAREALDVMAAQAIAETVVIDNAGYCVLSAHDLVTYPYEIKRRVVGRILRAVAGRDYAPTHSSLDSLIEWIVDQGTSTRTLGGCLFMMRHQNIWVMRETGRNDLPEMFIEPGQCVLWDNRMKISLSVESETPLTIKALGVENYARLKPGLESNLHVPSALGAGLPSFWHDHELIAVPHLNYCIARPVYQIDACFANSAQLLQVHGNKNLR